MAGVVFHFQDEKNFYVIRASALGHNLRFYKVVQGIRSDPIGPTMDISVGVWHTLAVQCQGNQITCWLDGLLAMPPLQDNTFTAGKVGFWTKSDAVSYFCNTAIDYTPRVSGGAGAREKRDAKISAHRWGCEFTRLMKKANRKSSPARTKTKSASPAPTRKKLPLPMLKFSLAGTKEQLSSPCPFATAMAIRWLPCACN